MYILRAICDFSHCLFRAPRTTGCKITERLPLAIPRNFGATLCLLTARDHLPPVPGTFLFSHCVCLHLLTTVTQAIIAAIISH